MLRTYNSTTDRFSLTGGEVGQQKKYVTWNPETFIQVLALLFTSCLTWANSLNYSNFNFLIYKMA